MDLEDDNPLVRLGMTHSSPVHFYSCRAHEFPEDEDAPTNGEQNNMENASSSEEFGE